MTPSSAVNPRKPSALISIRQRRRPELHPQVTQVTAISCRAQPWSPHTGQYILFYNDPTLVVNLPEAFENAGEIHTSLP